MTEDAIDDLESTAKEVIRDVIRQARCWVELDPDVSVDERAAVERDDGGFLVRVTGLDQPMRVRRCDMSS